MMGRLDKLPRKLQLIDWCLKRQNVGFQGRIEKPPDSCYSFWVGGTLKLLGAENFLQGQECAKFLSICEAKYTGGFQKLPESAVPDLLHTYFSICGLSLCGFLQPLNVELGMSERSFRAA